MSLAFSYIFLCLTFLTCYGKGSQYTNEVDTCPHEYRVIDLHHSFCSQPFPNVTDQQVTSSDRAYILELHNDERRLARGTNIEKMYWNDELADIALHYARTCTFEHDKPNQRSVPKIPLSTGQNLAMGYENWTDAIEGWIEEKEHYYHAFPSTNIFSRYSQMIWHSSVLIGCASTICPPFGPYNIPWSFYVCNYIPGMLNSNYHPAYTQRVEDHPLHDCQGKVCLYNGALDLDTCECQCSSYASGVQCEKLNCSILPPCPYHSSISCIAVDVPLDCPRLCGLCDRYEILKDVYGEDNLAPGAPPTMTTSTTTQSNFVYSSVVKKKVINTTTIPMIVLSNSSTKNLSYHIILYLFIKYLFVA